MALIFENKITGPDRVQFIDKVHSVSSSLGIDPNWLMAVMELETAGTFRADITNSIGATGLIQFMPSTAVGLGTTANALRSMSRVEQLDWVKKYYRPYMLRLNRYVDLYLATLFPVALGKPETWTLQSGNLTPGAVARANPLFDLNRDGAISVGEIQAKLLTRLPAAWRAYMSEKKKPILLIAGILSLLILAYLGYAWLHSAWPFKR